MSSNLASIDFNDGQPIILEFVDPAMVEEAEERSSDSRASAGDSSISLRNEGSEPRQRRKLSRRGVVSVESHGAEDEEPERVDQGDARNEADAFATDELRKAAMTKQLAVLKRIYSVEQPENPFAVETFIYTVDNWCSARFGGGESWFPGIVEEVVEVEGFHYCHILYDAEPDEDGDGTHQDYEQFVPLDRIVFFQAKKQKKARKK